MIPANPQQFPYQKISRLLPIESLDETLPAANLEIFECASLEVYVTEPESNLDPLLFLRLHGDVSLQANDRFREKVVPQVFKCHGLHPRPLHAELSEEFQA